MAKTVTFLTAVNDVLKQARVIQGSSGELTSFTDSSRQAFIDVMIRSWNDVLHELSRAGILEGEVNTSTFTLVTDTREYSLATDFVRMVGNPVEPTNNSILKPYPGGWLKMREDQPDPDDFDGRPNYWAINEDTGNIRVDTNPTSQENGLVYTYAYEAAINLTATGNTFPFDDQVVRSLYDAVVQTYEFKMKKQFNAPIFQAAMARAAHFARRQKARSYYGVRRAATG